ncbi:hypothetical protein MRBLMI12_001361 [Microbacterium sp. LMI12-1-1.1]|uniref:hypothetical protein n=1 Tax=Microbacterium sp. LMI12-1-1.1 TaxID=3135225 RepID=UPI003438299F
MTPHGMLRVDGTRIVADDGPVTLRGFGLGGWNMADAFSFAHRRIREGLATILGRAAR